MLSAEYRQGLQGRWLLTRWQAASVTDSLVILLPPFAEEMNCVRRLYAALGRDLAAQGIDAFLPDYYGTGDSEGSFADSSLPLWRADLLRFAETLRHYRRVHLLGCRFSAALLLDLLPVLQTLLPVSKVLLWQPLLQMDRFWQQLKRQQQLTQNHRQSEYEVAGYRLPMDLQTQSQQLNTDLSVLAGCQVLWLEAQLNGQFSAASLRLLSQQPQIRCQVHPLAPYWLAQEPMDCSLLLDVSRQFLLEPDT